MITIEIFLLLISLLFIRSAVIFDERTGQSQTVPLSREATQKLENHILDIFKIDGPPIAKRSKEEKNDPKSAFMDHLYKEMEEQQRADTRRRRSRKEKDGEEWHEADAIYSLSPTGLVVPASGGVHEVRFSLEDLPADSTLLTAQLRVILTNDTGGTKGFTKISILADRNGELRSLDYSIAPPHTTSRGFNITELVSDWIHNVAEPVLYIRVESGFDTEFSRKELDCFLVTAFLDGLGRTRSNSRNRQRRATEDDVPISPPAAKLKRSPSSVDASSEKSDDENAKPICSKQGLYVSFQEIGWQSWVTAPSGYSADFCVGACSFPLQSSLNATNHAIIQTLAHSVNRAEAAKCVPVKLTYLKIMFSDHNGNILIKKYNDMIVEECGCR